MQPLNWDATIVFQVFIWDDKLPKPPKQQDQAQSTGFEMFLKGSLTIF